jgi:hypothetical protein
VCEDFWVDEGNAYFRDFHNLGSTRIDLSPAQQGKVKASKHTTSTGSLAQVQSGTDNALDFGTSLDRRNVGGDVGSALDSGARKLDGRHSVDCDVGGTLDSGASLASVIANATVSGKPSSFGSYGWPKHISSFSQPCSKQFGVTLHGNVCENEEICLGQP